MKIITLPQGKIAVENRLILEGEYYLGDSSTTIFQWKMGIGIHKDKSTWADIVIASTFFISKDLPMWKEEVDELALAQFPRKINNPYNPQEDDNDEDRNIWIAGYKVAQSKGTFTEDEVRSLVDSVTEFISHHEPEEFNGWFEKKIQSLKEETVEFEMKMFDNNDYDDNSEGGTYPGNIKSEIQIKTTTDLSGQKWCIVKSNHF